MLEHSIQHGVDSHQVSVEQANYNQFQSLRLVVQYRGQGPDEEGSGDPVAEPSFAPQELCGLEQVILYLWTSVSPSVN